MVEEAVMDYVVVSVDYLTTGYKKGPKETMTTLTLMIIILDPANPAVVRLGDYGHLRFAVSLSLLLSFWLQKLVANAANENAHDKCD